MDARRPGLAFGNSGPLPIGQLSQRRPMCLFVPGHWLLTVSDAEWDGEGWVITAMTGTLDRAEVLDLSLGGGTAKACPPCQAEATWDAPWSAAADWLPGGPAELWPRPMPHR
jgi:hypothetical protein